MITIFDGKMKTQSRLPMLESFEINSPLNECIVLGYSLDDDIILAKNRDRNYAPNLEIVREVIDDGTELVYINDADTGWSEGMNSHGIGIANTALMIGRDENEKKIAKATGQKSQDGERIRQALTFSNIDDVIESILTYKGGVKGHTVISDGTKLYTIEMTSRHDAIVKEKNLEKPVIRTNHGWDYEDAGYDKGEDYLSSVFRRHQVKKNIEDGEVTDIDDILDALTKSKFAKNSPYNVVRDTAKMSTTNQLAMNLNKLEFYLKPIEGKVNFQGIKDVNVPDGYDPKIKIEIK